MQALSRSVARSLLGEARWSQLRTAPCAQWSRAWSEVVKPPAEDVDTHDDFKPTYKAPSEAKSVHDTIDDDIKTNPVMVYMKGVPDAPQCGFSNLVCRILDAYGAEYSSRNVLEDPDLRTGIKSFSKWPTVPQVFINGEFVGGSDILMQMHQSGELESLLEKARSQNSNK
eukprot:jgi/Chlat1/1439/Chrsp12S01999